MRRSTGDGDLVVEADSEPERVTKRCGSIEHWQKGELLGKGAFGTVYLGLNLDNGQLFAVKEIDQFDNSPGGRAELMALENEIAMLKRCQHPNIVRYLGYSHTNTCLSIFLEYVSGGSLCGLLERFGTLQEPVVQVYTRQILLGLEYLHHDGIAHRDIKGANVLVTHEGVVKLADFGASKRIWGSSSARSTTLTASADISGMYFGLRGTAMWMAPEVIREDQTETIWKKADIWSVGCTVIEMLTGKPPWSQFSNPITAMYHIACGENTPQVPESLSKNGKDFLAACFRKSPMERPDVTAILLYPFVANSRLARQTLHVSSGSNIQTMDSREAACPATPCNSWRYNSYSKKAAEARASKQHRKLKPLKRPTSHEPHRPDNSSPSWKQSPKLKITIKPPPQMGQQPLPKVQDSNRVISDPLEMVRDAVANLSLNLDTEPDLLDESNWVLEIPGYESEDSTFSEQLHKQNLAATVERGDRRLSIGTVSFDGDSDTSSENESSSDDDSIDEDNLERERIHQDHDQQLSHPHRRKSNPSTTEGRSGTFDSQRQVDPQKKWRGSSKQLSTLVSNQVAEIRQERTRRKKRQNAPILPMFDTTRRKPQQQHSNGVSSRPHAIDSNSNNDDVSTKSKSDCGRLDRLAMKSNLSNVQDTKKITKATTGSKQNRDRNKNVKSQRKAGLCENSAPSTRVFKGMQPLKRGMSSVTLKGRTKSSQKMMVPKPVVCSSQGNLRGGSIAHLLPTQETPNKSK